MNELWYSFFELFSGHIYQPVSTPMPYLSKKAWACVTEISIAGSEESWRKNPRGVRKSTSFVLSSVIAMCLRYPGFFALRALKSFDRIVFLEIALYSMCTILDIVKLKRFKKKKKYTTILGAMSFSKTTYAFSFKRF